VKKLEAGRYGRTCPAAVRSSHRERLPMTSTSSSPFSSSLYRGIALVVRQRAASRNRRASTVTDAHVAKLRD